MSWLVGDWQQVWQVAAKAALMFVVALAGLRGSERRTFAQWSIMDFVSAVAIGAIIGQTALSSMHSLLEGLVAVVTLLAVHRLASHVRRWPPMRPAFDHPVRVLVHDGRLRERELRRCGIDGDDVKLQLRARGVRDLADVRYLVYESGGQLTLVRRGEDGPLVTEALDAAPGFRRT